MIMMMPIPFRMSSDFDFLIHDRLLCGCRHRFGRMRAAYGMRGECIVIVTVTVIMIAAYVIVYMPVCFFVYS